ncbi:cytochrome b/b6 domain-containing protein [Synechococcus sp. CS-1329]|uniref:cytochrome b/b6 domain-containing protein n=1 Tax=Synechococcus sp. CS-1329 TaxID=2847975 RepID=UPI0021E39237|nr:cytochrome b/b6 domain-containing protein [Synechococcus sp. CS-1329]MCT0218658.1 cytochrome b/b6 domain-containing protein [Synechococcus sp. CS-1329]
MARPYQPSLLRGLHGITALLVLACWGSGLVVYSRYDGRWGRLPFELGGDWIDLHGSLGVALWPLALLFGLYSLSLGVRRLRQPANAAALLALGLAVGTGKLMQEDWLRQGQLQHLAYGLHLLAWLVIGAAVLAHLAAVLARGGRPLARSMFSLRQRSGDQPRDWPGQIRRHFRSSS